MQRCLLIISNLSFWGTGRKISGIFRAMVPLHYTFSSLSPTFHSSSSSRSAADIKGGFNNVHFSRGAQGRERPGEYRVGGAKNLEGGRAGRVREMQNATFINLRC